MSDSFSDYLIDTINKGSLSLMLSIGHRTRLFDIMSTMPPSTIEEVSKKANLNPSSSIHLLRSCSGRHGHGQIVGAAQHQTKIFVHE